LLNELRSARTHLCAQHLGRQAQPAAAAVRRPALSDASQVAVHAQRAARQAARAGPPVRQRRKPALRRTIRAAPARLSWGSATPTTPSSSTGNATDATIAGPAELPIPHSARRRQLPDVAGAGTKPARKGRPPRSPPQGRAKTIARLMRRKHGDRRSCARGQAKGDADFAPRGAVATLAVPRQPDSRARPTAGAR